MLPRSEHGQRSDRPTLPRIGDILGDELSRSPRASHMSPPMSKLSLHNSRTPEFDQYSDQPLHSRASMAMGKLAYARDADEHMENAVDLRYHRHGEILPAEHANFDSSRTSHSYSPSRASPRMRRRFSDTAESMTPFPYPETSRNKSHSLSECSDLIAQRHLRDDSSRSSHTSNLRHPHSTSRPSGQHESSSISYITPNIDHSIRLPPIHDPYDTPQSFVSPSLQASSSLPHMREPELRRAYGKSESDLRSYRFLNHQGAETSTQKSSLPPRYECPYCSKRFSRPSSLKTHTHHHTGEKPFVCPFPECGRGFSVYSNMRRHTRLHTQDSQKQNETSGEEGGEGSTVSSSSPPRGSPAWLPQVPLSVYGDSVEVPPNSSVNHSTSRSRVASSRSSIPTSNSTGSDKGYHNLKSRTTPR